MRYLCYNRSRYPGSCNGQSVYVSQKLDSLVESVARRFFDSLKDQPKELLIKNRYENRKNELEINLKMITAVYNEHLAEMKEYESETLKVIRGESKLRAELINKLYEEAKTKVEQAQNEIKRIETEMKNDQTMQDSFARQYDKVVTWATLYDSSDMDTKKMVISQLFSKVSVSRGYQLDIDVNLTIEQMGFQLQTEIEEDHLDEDESIQLGM